ncbi:MAG: PEP-CTERM sorting domain-containing protein [Chthoniobacterales bacterium]
MRIRPYSSPALILTILVASSSMVRSATDTWVLAESANRQASADAEDIGTTTASVDVFQQDSQTPPNTVTVRASALANTGFLSQSVYFEKNRNEFGNGLDFLGRASANGRFNDTLQIVPNDPAMTGNSVRLEVQIRLSGSGQVSQAEGSNGTFAVRSGIDFGQYDLGDPDSTFDRSSLALAASIRSDSSGDFPGGVNSVTTGGEARIAYLSLALNEIAGIYAEQSLTAQITRSTGGQFVGGTLEGDFDGTIQFTRLLNDAFEPLNTDDFSFVTGTGTNYFAAIPEPTTLGLLGLATLAAVGAWTRKRPSRP